MATINTTVCDRCGKIISTKMGWTTKFYNVSKKRNKVKFHYLYNGNMTGHDYTTENFELCQDCTEELKKFLENKL